MKSLLPFAIILLASAMAAHAAPPSPELLEKSGGNRKEIEKALAKIPEPQRAAMEFLIENMPAVDLQGLTGDYIIENVALAHEAFNAAPWAKQVPPEIFMNDVLPYASLNERRDNWRSRLRKIAAPIVKDCTTPGEAAQALNRQLFRTVKVRYSTQRKKPDQSALESMESGVATCSGLSILLVDACRSVGIPARVAGTPMWTNLRGNHTWVEVWDGGWHFTGAAEPDGQGLDRGWFKGDASKARADVAAHAIYASSFKKTGTAFPLVWNPGIDWVQAVNVTDRYTAPAAPPPDGRVKLLVRVLSEGKRVAAKVTVADSADAALKLSGTSSDESADLNNILVFPLARGRAFSLSVERDGRAVTHEVKTTPGTEAEQTVTVTLPK